MAVTTNPRQPVVYDMMLLADALLALRELEGAGRREAGFCERQKNLETALTKIRNLAQFLSGTGSSDLIKVTDVEFGGRADTRFQTGHFDRISKYVSHLHEQRWKKDAKYPQPTASEALHAGKQVLDQLKPLMDPLKSELQGGANSWHEVFSALYGRL